MKLLDRVLSGLFPRAAYNRERFRMAHEMLQDFRGRERNRRDRYGRRGYEAASEGRRTGSWRTTAGSPNEEIKPALSTMRARHRDLVRNNGFAERAVRMITAKTIGTGMQPALPARLNRNLEEQILELWGEWAGETACDIQDRHTFAGLQRLVWREVVEAGEAVVRFVFSQERELPVRVQLQLLEPDHIDTNKDFNRENGNPIIHGVEFDTNGRRVAYWLFEDHPGAHNVNLRRRSFGKSVRVDAGEILHVFRADRIGQVRGVPWGAPVILTTRDFDGYLDAQLLRQRIAASFAAFTHTSEAPVAAALPGDTADTSDEIEEIEAGTIRDLPPGREITFSNPPQVTGIAEYSRVTLRQIAMGYELPYELLTGDLTGVNFSSGKLGRVDFQSLLDEYRELHLVPQLCTPVWRTFVNAALIANRLPEDTPRRVRWTPPARDMIDPRYEVPAVTRRIRSGQTTLSEFLRTQGVANPRRFLEERAADDKLLTELGLQLDSDPRVQPPPQGGLGGARITDLLQRLEHRGRNGRLEPSEETS